jgi:hypothetical protein
VPWSGSGRPNARIEAFSCDLEGAGRGACVPDWQAGAKRNAGEAHTEAQVCFEGFKQSEGLAGVVFGVEVEWNFSFAFCCTV